MNHRDRSVSGRDRSHARTDRFVGAGRARYVHCFARFLTVSNGLGVLASNCHTQTPARSCGSQSSGVVQHSPEKAARKLVAQIVEISAILVVWFAEGGRRSGFIVLQPSGERGEVSLRRGRNAAVVNNLSYPLTDTEFQPLWQVDCAQYIRRAA
jgi:hypothetical protein